jgi:uncharacterized protein YbjT (DUF2867 family)
VVTAAPCILVLGAGGLIGYALAVDLQRRGFMVRSAARRFTAAQAATLHECAVSPLTSLDDRALAEFLSGADIVINCIGVLQGAESDVVHHAFAARLAGICGGRSRKLLIHMSVPGDEKDDRTPFSRTKREGERAIAASGAPFVILRPGFVIASTAYGGSALIRALAVLPLRLPYRESRSRFAATAMVDLCETVARLSARWRGGEMGWSASWDVMEEVPGTVGDIVEIVRAHIGGPRPLLRLPGWMMAPGVLAGDAVALLGWRPPLRSTAIAEMRRGVAGDPGPWIASMDITPLSAQEAVALLGAGVQERWFARLYLLKALALVTLVIFWCVSGAIALTVAFGAARATLIAHGFSFGLAHAVTIISSLIDISVGAAIALRRTCHFGLVTGIIVSLGYMAGAAIIAPDIWIEPLGALVKTGPAIVLMLFCLATLDDR